MQKKTTTDSRPLAIVHRQQEDQTVYHIIVCRQNPAQGEKRLIYLDDFCIKVKMATWTL